MSFQQIGSIVSLLLGVFFVADGIRALSNRSSGAEHDSAGEGLLSPYTRYWIGRYYNGFDLVKAGLGLVALAGLLHFAKL